jgi:NTP pyrophosphatase (non-canonical NTP hydrolase)
MLKIVEEVGELSQAVLAKDGLQRKIKLKNLPRIDHEIADVLITTMLLAENLEIDIEKSLNEKITKIKNRNY